eukprot:3949310-Pyramimonas_sp.AAC.1
MPCCAVKWYDHIWDDTLSHICYVSYDERYYRATWYAQARHAGLCNAMQCYAMFGAARLKQTGRQ